MSTTRRLRELLAGPGTIRSLGAHDVFTARLVEAAGLETVFIGGFGTSASLLGLPDVGFITLPNGHRIAVAMFARQGTNRPATIARAARMVFDGFTAVLRYPFQAAAAATSSAAYAHQE